MFKIHAESDLEYVQIYHFLLLILYTTYSLAFVLDQIFAILILIIIILPKAAFIVLSFV